MGKEKRQTASVIKVTGSKIQEECVKHLSHGISDEKKIM